MRNAKEFLDLCRRRFPSPRKDQRHTLTLEGDMLVLTLMRGDHAERFNILDEDFNKPAPLLLAELNAVIKTPQKRVPVPTPSEPTPVA